MEYDMLVHLPRQVELFLEAINTKNGELFDSTYSSIKEIIDNGKFLKILEGYDKDLENRNKEIEKDLISDIQDTTKTGSMDKVMQKLNEGFKDVDDNHKKYIETVKICILAWVKTIKEKET